MHIRASAYSFVRAYHGKPRSLQSQLNTVVEVPDKNGLWSARKAQLQIHITNQYRPEGIE